MCDCRNLIGQGAFIFKVFNSLITIIPLIIITYILYLLYIRTSSSLTLSNTFLIISFVIIWIIVLWMLGREFENSATKIPASWFGILNSFYIIVFAPVLSKIWQSRFNPSGPFKFGIGLILLAFGFGILSFGSL